MGVMSRRVLPVCGNLCFFCPSLRARSRQPVKRYKKFLADIFPRNQGAEPNDRKIGKLCEYASKNPLRIPKITDTLEQRFYKELRHENYGSVKVVLCIYRKLSSSCKEQMPLFASSLLGVIRVLLEQTAQDEMRILACNILVDFIDNQTDSTHMFNLEGLIPKLCQVAQDVADGEQMLLLHSAGLQALASMVSFMGEHSHISMEFDMIISVTLENYIDSQIIPEDSKEEQWVQGVLKAEENDSSFSDISKKVSLNVNDKPELDPLVDTSRSPSYWSRVCLRNMARLAKEATTVRRVLEPLFHNFDTNNHWPIEKGVAYPVLIYLQSLLEEAGENSHLLLSNLVKHLDHKNVFKHLPTQTDIVNVTTRLAQNAKQEVTVSILGTISDLVKHLRKCLQNSIELSSSGDNGTAKQNADLQFAIEKCISQLSNKVGDTGPVLDSMAVFLENISTTSIVARTTISAVKRTTQLIASIPNVSYHKKAFPDALFHQLLVAMTHPDHVTRVGAHSTFSAVLMPSLLSLWLDQNQKTSEAISVLLGAIHKSNSRSFSVQDDGKDKIEAINGVIQPENSQTSNIGGKEFGKNATMDGKTRTNLRLSSHQISLLLSSIWVQASSSENMPENFEAMAHTYNIALLFTRSKASNHLALVRFFQLSFSLRSFALDQDRGLPPSRRRSLFTLASYMIIFSAKAGNIPELIPVVKASLTENTADPYLESVEDIRLQTTQLVSNGGKELYGTEEDDTAASKSLSAVELNDHYLKETAVTQFMKKFEKKLTEDDLSIIKSQLLQEFLPDDAYPLGAPLFMETPKPSSPLAVMEFQAFEEIMPAASLTDDEIFTEANGSQSDRKTSLSGHAPDILSVNDLLESVFETARQVASSQVSSTPVPYDQMKSQCEALVTGKQQKMLMLHSFKNQNDSRIFPTEDEKKATWALIQNNEFSQSDDNQVQASDQLALCSVEHGQNSFRLPPSSPFDKFLKAAGC